MISNNDLCVCLLLSWCFHMSVCLGPGSLLCCGKGHPGAHHFVCKAGSVCSAFPHRHHFTFMYIELLHHWGLSVILQIAFILTTCRTVSNFVTPLTALFSRLWTNRLSYTCQRRPLQNSCMTFLYCLVLEQLGHIGNRRTLNSKLRICGLFFFF